MEDIKFRSDSALYLQIADHFRRQVARGKILPGERLPAIRTLAQKLNLDPGTVARAYRQLEKHGITVSRRGGGSFIADNADKSSLNMQQQKQLGAMVEKTIMEALGLGFRSEDIETAFALRLVEWRERRRKPAAPNQPLNPPAANHVRFYGSHDIAIELLAGHLKAHHPETNLVTSFVGSLAGLMALENGEADIAGAHLLDNETGQYNIPFITRIMPNENVVVINLMQRVQGLMFASGNPKHIIGLNDLVRPDVTFVNRQKGSGTRMLLDSQLIRRGIDTAAIKGYENEEKTHVAVATLIADGQADSGLGAQSAADNAGLDFIPLFKERYDLITLKNKLSNPHLQDVIDALHQESFHQMLRSLPGYDLTDIGNTITVDVG